VLSIAWCHGSSWGSRLRSSRIDVEHELHEALDTRARGPSSVERVGDLVGGWKCHGLLDDPAAGRQELVE
jgi:hypothetical protein